MYVNLWAWSVILTTPVSLSSIQHIVDTEAHYRLELEAMRKRHHKKFADATEKIRTQHKDLAKRYVAVEKQLQKSSVSGDRFHPFYAFLMKSSLLCWCKFGCNLQYVLHGTGMGFASTSCRGRGPQPAQVGVLVCACHCRTALTLCMGNSSPTMSQLPSCRRHYQVL